MFENKFEFHGIVWQLEASEETLVARLSRDFEKYITSESKEPDFGISIQKDLPVQNLKPFLIPGKSYRFSLGFNKRFFQFDEGLCGMEKFGKTRQLVIYGSNQSRLREVVLSYVHSVLGELMDMLGWHRLHACGIEIQKGECLAIPLNSEGGKSSFTFWASQKTQTPILSDETLFSDGKSVIGFYTRLSLRFRPEQPFEIYHRHGQKEKFLTDIPPERLLSHKCRLALWLPENKWNKINFFFTFVLGLGSAQMIEFFIRPNNVFSLLKILMGRTRTGFRMLNRVSMSDSWQKQESQNFELILKRFQPT